MIHWSRAFYWLPSAETFPTTEPPYYDRMIVGKNQPRHEGQLWLDDVHPGLVYIQWWQDRITFVIRQEGLFAVLEEPRIVRKFDKDSLKVNVIEINPNTNYRFALHLEIERDPTQDEFCESMGVCPDERGYWNQWRWITREDG